MCTVRVCTNHPLSKEQEEQKNICLFFVPVHPVGYLYLNLFFHFSVSKKCFWYLISTDHFFLSLFPRNAQCTLSLSLSAHSLPTSIYLMPQPTPTLRYTPKLPRFPLYLNYVVCDCSIPRLLPLLSFSMHVDLPTNSTTREYPSLQATCP